MGTAQALGAFVADHALLLASTLFSLASITFQTLWLNACGDRMMQTAEGAARGVEDTVEPFGAAVMTMGFAALPLALLGLVFALAGLAEGGRYRFVPLCLAIAALPWCAVTV